MVLSIIAYSLSASAARCWNTRSQTLLLADAIYTVSQMPEPPLRTVLGMDAYAAVEASYTKSLAALQAQKDLAASVMFEGKTGFVPG
jgi:hypothetical protein